MAKSRLIQEYFKSVSLVWKLSQIIVTFYPTNLTFVKCKITQLPLFIV